MKKASITIIYASLLIISSLFIFNTVSATPPIQTCASIYMKQDEVNRTLTVVSIDYAGEGPVEFRGNASYPLPPLELGDKITNCSGYIIAVQLDSNCVAGSWQFSGDTNYNITSYSYALIDPHSESKKTPGFELIPILIAIALVLFWQRRKI